MLGYTAWRQRLEKQGEPFRGSAMQLVKALGPDEATMASVRAVSRRESDEAVRQITGSAKRIERTTTN